MSYPGDPKLGADIRQRVEQTFEQSKQLAVEGKQQEATLGCEFVLRLDPLYEPARDLIAKIEAGEAVPSQSPAESASFDPAGAATGNPESFADLATEVLANPEVDLHTEIDDLLERRDFRTVLNLAQEHPDALAADPGLGGKVQAASDRLEAEPYMRNFLDAAEAAQREGRNDEAEALVEKARALDPSHPGLPPVQPGAVVHESNDRIRELLEEGQGSLDRGDHQGAIDSWSRIFLIDIDHPEANQRIESARRLKAESERQVDEAFHEGVSLWELGTTDKAREQFERVLELDPSHPGAKDYIERMNARAETVAAESQAEAALDMPLSTPDSEILMPPAPADSGAGTMGFDPIDSDIELPDEAFDAASTTSGARAKTGSGLLNRRFMILAGAGLLALIAVLALAYFKKDALFPNGDGPAAAQVDVLERARTLHEKGQSAMAIAQLNRIPTDNPQYVEAQALIAQWEAPVEEEAAEPEGPSAESLAEFDDLIASARQARDDREHLRAAALYEQAAGIAPLGEEDQLVQSEVAQRLVGLEDQIEMFENGDWEFVLPQLWRLHSANPEDKDIIRLMVDSYYNLGVRDLQRGDTVAAAEKFLRASELDPSDARVDRLSRFSAVYEERPADLLYRIFVKYLPFR